MLRADARRRFILLRLIGKPSAHERQFLAIMRFHMFAGSNIEHGEPVIGQIAAAGGIIFGNVARDIGKLKRKA